MEAKMPWSSYKAAQDMWINLDKNFTHGQELRYFKQFLQAAYNIGVEESAQFIEHKSRGYTSTEKQILYDVATSLRSLARATPATTC
jgi:hypothetical protein